MNHLFHSIAKHLPRPNHLFEKTHHKSSNDTLEDVVSNAQVSHKPILQLNKLPMTINPDLYKNPQSPTNPGGDYRALYAFRQLVDPIPIFSEAYTPSSSSTESTYETIVNSASALSSGSFATNIIANSKKALEQNTIANLDGSPGAWRPAYAMPSDWFSNRTGLYQNLTFNLSQAGSDDLPFTQIGQHDSLKLTVDDKNQPQRKTISNSSQIHSIKLKYLMVEIHRPWLNPTLFKTGDWTINGQNSGFCSSGKIASNTGIFPLIPTAILLGKRVSVNASWSNEDANLINKAKNQKTNAFIGPFPCNNNTEESIQVIGLISNLVPYSPMSKTNFI